MTSKIGGFIGGGNWKYAHGTAHYGRNFSVKWLKVLYPLYLNFIYLVLYHFRLKYYATYKLRSLMLVSKISMVLND